MLSTEEVKYDLQCACEETGGHWFCYDDIYTKNYNQDALKYIAEMRRFGYSINDLLHCNYVMPAYGGGYEIIHQQEALSSGYTIIEGEKKRCLIVVSGFDRDVDKHVVYHEICHAYQLKYNILGQRSTEYQIYLSETHANVFSTMVLLLKSKNMLEYKKRKLCRFADGVSTFSSSSEESLYYLSLPVELALMKEIRRRGRKNVIRDFSDADGLNFKKIAEFTAEYVKKYAFSSNEFLKIQQQKFPLKYIRLKKKFQAFRILGKEYHKFEKRKYRQRRKNYDAISEQRISQMKENLKELPEDCEENKVINAACKLDFYQVYLMRKYNMFTALSDVIAQKTVYRVPKGIPENAEKLENINSTIQKMRMIYQKWKDNPRFLGLVDALQYTDSRDDVWELKEARKEEIKEATSLKSQNQGRSF